MSTYPLIHPFNAMSATDDLPVIVSSSGARLTDSTGETYLDGISSLWAVNLGHGNDAVKDAIRERLARTDYTTLFGLAHTSAVEFAELMASALPIGLDRLYLTSGGSEAVESAFKFAMIVARARYGRDIVPHVIHLRYSYHGVSLGALSAMGLDDRALFEPLLSTFHQAPSPYLYREGAGADPTVFARERADAVDQLVSTVEASSPAARVAAVIVEPVQGAGGIIPPPDGYLRRLREICDARGVCLIADEVATGFWRTGDLFAVDREDVVPDLLTFGKAASAGYLPLGGVAVGAAAFDTMSDFLGPSSLPHGYTFGGAPLACAAGVAAVRQYLAPGFGDEVRRKAKILADHAEELAALPAVGDVRQRGLMLGVELVADRATRRPFPSEANMTGRVVREARRRRLILRPVDNNTVPLFPPLTTSDHELGEMVTRLAEAVTAATAA
jgi:adenosylmethionine---8-amino-7-oxononanoate aminotransferase